MTVIVKSGVPGKAPTTNQLDYGQLAINYFDGVLYYKNYYNQIIPVTIGSGTGTVTSVGLSAPSEFTVTNSPITTTGNLTITKSPQQANYVWAGPVSGAAAEPSFRALVAEDIQGIVPSVARTFAFMGA